MQFKKTILATSVVASFGAGLVISDVAFAGTVAAGSYDLVVLQTPTVNYFGTLFGLAGKDGAWNSTFTFNGQVPRLGGSQPMFDNDVRLAQPDGSFFGSGIFGDGYAGILGIDIDSSGNLSVSSFSKDTIAGTAGGNFAQQHNNPSQMSGSVDLASGAMALVTTGRLGCIDGGSLAPCNLAWNNDNVGPFQEYATFRTSTASTDTNTINGAVLTSIGDVNGDTIVDYSAVLVSGGDVGTAWGSFAGIDYFETWAINLLSKPSGPVAPIPAAIWLLGSGLLGLVGAAQRKAN